MILTAHQTAYLPWLVLLNKIALADTFVYLDTVQYAKKDFQNRNRINTPQGSIWLTVPVVTKGKFNQLIKDVEIDNQRDWRKKHWKSILMSYGNARYFNKYAEWFENCYNQNWIHLSDLNNAILTYLLEQFGIKTKYLIASREMELIGEKSGMIIAMCQKLNADTYIFGSMGREYADLEAFSKAGIKVIFQHYIPLVYFQKHYQFEYDMAAIDLLFNHGEDSLEMMMVNNRRKDYDAF